jgi:hypothetical protein
MSQGDRCLAAVVASDASRAVYVTRAAEDIVHLFAPGARETVLPIHGAPLRKLEWSPDLRVLGLQRASGKVETYRDGALVDFAGTVRKSFVMSNDGHRIAWVDGDHVHVEDALSTPLSIPVVGRRSRDALDLTCFLRKDELELDGDTVRVTTRSDDPRCPTSSSHYDLKTRKGYVDDPRPPPKTRAWDLDCAEPAVRDELWIGCVDREGQLRLWDARTGATLWKGLPETAQRLLMGTVLDESEQ